MVKIPYSDMAKSQEAIPKTLEVFSKDQSNFGGYGKLGSFQARHYTLGWSFGIRPDSVVPPNFDSPIPLFCDLVCLGMLRTEHCGV
jgi:hypothetical protein